VAVSPASAELIGAATTTPVSRSTACSGLKAKWVEPSFIRAIFASGSVGLVQSSFESFLPFRLRSSRTKSSIVGVSTPLSLAIRVSIWR
jgi:hypothetical protein